MFGIAYAEYEPSDAKGFVKTVVVANYFPCGNVENKFQENVVEPSETATPGVTSKVQRKIDQYKKKRSRRPQNNYTVFRGRKPTHVGNLV